MAEFEKRLDTAAQSQSICTTSDVTEEFVSFKLFMVNSHHNLQQQLDKLAKQLKRVNMSLSRKLLLVHSILAAKNELFLQV